MAVTDLHELRLSFDASEMELLRQVASEEKAEVSAWAREVLLKEARSRQVEKPAKKRVVTRPQCGCGGTASPKGECDLTCIMRY